MTLDTVVRCRFLGHAQIEIGHTLVTPEAERLFALLMVLACEAGRSFARDELVRLLWPDVPEDRGKHSLRQSIYKARQAGAPFETSGDDIRLPKAAVWRDWDQPKMPVHGEWLGAYTAAFSDGLAVWVLGRRATIHAGLRPRMVAHMQGVRSSGDIHEAGRLAEQILRIDPLNEEAVLVTAESFAMAGAKVDALRLLDEYIEEVGKVSDSAELLIPAKVLRVRIAEKLPVATYATGEPHEMTLVGRDRELKQLVSTLFDLRGRRGGTTWLWGSEGIGKSRLIHEQLKAATLQGIRVVRETYSREAAGKSDQLRSLLKRLLETPGALGTDPDTLSLLRDNAEGRRFTPAEELRSSIAELLHAIAEEQSLLIVLDGADSWPLKELLLLAEVISDLHGAEAGLLVSTRRSPVSLGVQAPTGLVNILPLARLSTDDIAEILEQRAQQLKRPLESAVILGPSIASEGIPGFAIEFLGQLLNPADGDAVPFKVRKAILAAAATLSELERNALAAVWAAGSEAPLEMIAACAGTSEGNLRALLGSLLDANLIVQRSTGYSVLSPIEMFSKELVPQACNAAFLVSCAEAIRDFAKETGLSDRLFRAYFLLATASHQGLAASWAAEDLAYIMSHSSATTILQAIDWLEESVGLSGELTVLSGIAAEIRIRAGDYSLPRSTELRGEQLITTLPATPTEEIAYYNKVVGMREYNSAMDSASDVTLVHIERARAATQAIVIGDNLQDASLVSRAAEVLEVLGNATLGRSLDVARGRLIAACVLNDHAGTEQRCAEITKLVQDEPDRAEACKALRTVFHARMATGHLEEARGAILQSIQTARVSEFWNHVAIGEQCLSFLSIAQLNASAAEAHINEAVSICRSRAISTPLILFDNQLAAVWCKVLAADQQAASKELRRLETMAPDSDSAVTTRQIAFLRFALKGGIHTLEDENEAVSLAESLGRHRPDDKEDRNAYLLKIAVRGTELEARVGQILANYVNRKDALGHKTSPMAGALRA